MLVLGVSDCQRGVEITLRTLHGELAQATYDKIRLKKKLQHAVASASTACCKAYVARVVLANAAKIAATRISRPTQFYEEAEQKPQEAEQQAQPKAKEEAEQKPQEAEQQAPPKAKEEAEKKPNGEQKAQPTASEEAQKTPKEAEQKVPPSELSSLERRSTRASLTRWVSVDPTLSINKLPTFLRLGSRLPCTTSCRRRRSI